MSNPRDYFLNLTPGKLLGLRRVADNDGRFHVLALDQTGVFHGAFGGDLLRIGHAKIELTKRLGPAASSVLLDVTTSARQAINSSALAREVGLVVRLEKPCAPGDHAFEEPGWSVAKIKRMGADAVKLLVYLDVEDEKYTRAQLEFVKRTAGHCREHDILLMTEALSFPRRNALEPDGSSPHYLERRVKNIIASAELLGPHADVLKLEFPGISHLADLNHAAQRPWVLLSAGVDYEPFKAQVEAAMKAGASGVMAGRAIFKEWLDPHSPHFQSSAFLEREALRRMDELRKIIARYATPWLQRYHLTLEDLVSAVELRWYSSLATGLGGEDKLY